MKLLLIKFCILASVYGFAPRVITENGKLIGTTYTLPNGRTVFAFFGIPYAESPIGYNRFEPPKAVSRWRGNYNGTFLRDICPQYSHFGRMAGEFVGKEDCLYLNIFTPELPKKKKTKNLMNVMVHIHGGAFLFGSGGTTTPDYLLQNDDIVFVTMNYRLGVLGFLSTNNLIAPGNNGLKDQVMALKWIKTNIHYFGGDSMKVTIQGISAGGVSVHFHALSPLSIGLFQSGIASSGTATMSLAVNKKTHECSMKLISLLRCPTDGSYYSMQCLRSKSLEEIFETTTSVQKLKLCFDQAFGPVIEPESDTAFLSEHPLALIKRGKVREIPFMISLVRFEALGIIPQDQEKLKELNDNWYEVAPVSLLYDRYRPFGEQDHISDEVKKFYFGNNSISLETYNELIRLFSDRYFDNGVTESAKLHAAANIYENTYCYKFSYEGRYSFFNRKRDKILGPGHCDDQFYLFNFEGRNPVIIKQDKDMSKFLVSAIISFMKNGDPNFDSKMAWKPVSKNGDMANCLNIYSPKLKKMENIENTHTTLFWKNLLGVKEDPQVNSISTKDVDDGPSINLSAD